MTTPIVHLVGDEDDWTACDSTPSGEVVTATHNPTRVTCASCLATLGDTEGARSRVHGWRVTLDAGSEAQA